MGTCLSTVPEVVSKDANNVSKEIELVNGQLPSWANTISFVPPITSGYVIKVYDGDTITIAARLPYKDSPMYRFSVRLARIDSPELRTKDASEHDAAVLARDALAKLILGRTIELTNTGTEKYGRLLAEVWCDLDNNVKMNINDWMLQNHYAVEYDGGKKEAFQG